MQTVNTVDLRADLGAILNRVEFKNESLIIIRHGRQCAVITPLAEKQVVSDPTASLTSSLSEEEDDYAVHKEANNAYRGSDKVEPAPARKSATKLRKNSSKARKRR